MASQENPISIPRSIIPVFAQITGKLAARTIRMALDTGASITMIPAEKIVATGHAIPTTRDKMIKMFTASGIEYVPVVIIKKFSCLGITIKNISVLCHSLPSESPVEGLLGLNFLIHVPAFIEFYKKITLCR